MIRGVHHQQLVAAIKALEYMPGVWVGGGAGRTLYNNDPIKDIDMFFCSAERQAEWVEMMRVNGAVRQKNGNQWHYRGMWYDASINIYCKTPQELVDTVDFTVCGVFCDLKMNITATPAHVEDIRNRELRSWKGFVPAPSIRRAFSLIEKGYRPTDDVAFWVDVHSRIRKYG
jgi:hypothetical protein